VICFDIDTKIKELAPFPGLGVVFYACIIAIVVTVYLYLAEKKVSAAIYPINTAVLFYLLTCNVFNSNSRESEHSKLETQ